jgi:hypothetical protein
MTDLRLSTAWTLHGLHAIVLENRVLRLVVLPEAGGKVWQITYKPHDADLLWNSPRIAPARHVIHAPYDDVWAGGMDEIFPTDETGTIEGDLYPDHGELWTGAWTAETFQAADEAGVRLRFETPISAFVIEKTIRLRPASARVEFDYTLTNASQQRFPFLWKLHPALAVTPRHRIDFPAMRVEREPDFAGTLSAAPLSFAWPYAEAGSQRIDLRRVPETTERAVHFVYGTEMAAGWCALTNTASGLAACLQFDQSVFPSCWLFASFGGWRNLNVAVLEPCTGYPFRMASLLAAGRERALDAGESLRTRVLLTMQESLTSVGSVDADGRLHPAVDEAD